ncbi:hypothetical protein [Persicirhabdus sediminis]|nr:hypothetical protein [Persicirhabdus sediminis]
MGSYFAGLALGWLATSGALLAGDAKQQLLDEGVEQIVFATRHQSIDAHYYASFGHYAQSENTPAYTEFGQLVILDVDSGEMNILLEDEKGGVRDPQMHYDGKKILFSYRPGGSPYFNLYEIDIASKELRQITKGEYDDIEPSYLPNGDIVFVSTRSERWVNCWATPSATIHRCDENGENIHVLSSNIEQDNTPWVLPDGRILYTRWEYVDRSQFTFHHLWTMHPDGTRQQAYFGNMHPGLVFIDGKPIPGSDEVLFSRSPKQHGWRDHKGYVARVSAKKGPDHEESLVVVNDKVVCVDPYPISKDLYIAAQETALITMTPDGEVAKLFDLPKQLIQQGLKIHEPRPVRPRARESIIPDRTDAAEETGTMILSNVYEGRNMDGIEPGSIRELLIMETLPKPVNHGGTQPPISFFGTFTLMRTLGTVPVEEDGSAHFEVPAKRPIVLAALDEEGNSVQRMLSFTTVMPGEKQSCIGCHEDRVSTPPPSYGSMSMALKREASIPKLAEHRPEIYDFPRDIQPILDRHCVECHSPDKLDGRVNLSGDDGPIFTHSYHTLTVLQEAVDNRNRANGSLPPYSFGSGASPLMKKLSGDHYDVKLSDTEIDIIRGWLDTGSAFPGTYAALGSGIVGNYDRLPEQYHGRMSSLNQVRDWPESVAASKVIRQDCMSCHTDNRRLPLHPADHKGIPHWSWGGVDKPIKRDMEWQDRELVFSSNHQVFNLSRPDKSLMLQAPLSKEQGGLGICVSADGKPVIESDDSETYQLILKMVERAKQELDGTSRFNRDDFVPLHSYLRQMKNYGIIPEEYDPAKHKIDPYEVDELYFQKHWYRAEGEFNEKATLIER